MKRIKLILLTAAAGALLTGCFKEDYSMCRPEGNNVKLNFRLPDGNGGCTFLNDITEVHTAVYDAGGVLVKQLRSTETEHAVFKGVYMNLAPGTYKVICWANSNGNTCLNRPEHCYTDSNATIGYSSASGNRVGDCDPVYYGPNSVVTRTGNDRGEYVLTVGGDGHEGTVDFRYAHRIVEIYVKGYEENGVTTPPVELSGLPSGLSFLGMAPLTPENPVTSTMDSRVVTVREEGQDVHYSLARFRVFYFKASDRSIGIDVLSPSNGRNVFHTTLNEWIDAGRDDPAQTQTLRLVIEFKGITTEVRVPGWNSDDIGWGL